MIVPYVPTAGSYDVIVPVAPEVAPTKVSPAAGVPFAGAADRVKVARD